MYLSDFSVYQVLRIFCHSLRTQPHKLKLYKWFKHFIKYVDFLQYKFDLSKTVFVATNIHTGKIMHPQ